MILLYVSATPKPFNIPLYLIVHNEHIFIQSGKFHSPDYPRSLHFTRNLFNFIWDINIIQLYPRSPISQLHRISLFQIQIILRSIPYQYYPRKSLPVVSPCHLLFSWFFQIIANSILVSYSYLFQLFTPSPFLLSPKSIRNIFPVSQLDGSNKKTIFVVWNKLICDLVSPLYDF